MTSATAPVDLARQASRSRSGFRTYGVFALALFLLATSKWGSYLPLSKPPFVSDILLGLLLVRYVLYARRGATIVRDGTPLRPLVSTLLFWIALELVRGSFSIVALRDFAPYFYAIAVFLVVAPPSTAKHSMTRAIDIVMIFHAAWISLGLAVPSLYRHMPSFAGHINLLAPRNDFDGAVCAIFVAYTLHRALSGRFIIANLSLAVWNLIVLFALKERAGLLSLAVVLVVVIALRSERIHLTRAARAKALVPIILLCLPLVVTLSSNTYAYQRLLAAVHSYVPFVHSKPQYVGATGTEHARSKAWSRIIGWTGDSSSREIAGVGFGPDFMHASGADVLLLGGANSDVRSPHNYYVGSWARLGLIGLALVSVITLCGLWLAVLVTRSANPLNDVDVLAILVVAGLPIAAAVGVILESPFGAVPWFWALGHLSVRSAELRGHPTEPARATVMVGT